MKLTDEQQKILASLHGPLRIAAGAGTGKTDTLRLAIVELIERGVLPGQILCLTFTVEATKEMRRRVYTALADRSDLDPDLTVQTYHAFAASIVREHALLAGLDGDPALLDDARAWQLALEALDRCSFDELEISSVGYFVSKLLALNEELQRHAVSVPDDAGAGESLDVEGLPLTRRDPIRVQRITTPAFSHHEVAVVGCQGDRIAAL